jgi:hypothetical protein
MKGYIVTTDNDEAPSRILREVSATAYLAFKVTYLRLHTYTNSVVTTPRGQQPAVLQGMSRLEQY